MKKVSISTIGELKRFLSENDVPDNAEIIMYNAMDEGDCCAESAAYYTPGERANSDYYCQGDSVFDYGFKNLSGAVVLFG